MLGATFLVALVSLLIPAHIYRNYGEENPPTYNCGLPLTYIAGKSERPWRIAEANRTAMPTTVPGQPPAPKSLDPVLKDFPKPETCKQAMAPRLGFTVWVLLLGTALSIVVLVAQWLDTNAEASTSASKNTIP